MSVRLNAIFSIRGGPKPLGNIFKLLVTRRAQNDPQIHRLSEFKSEHSDTAGASQPTTQPFFMAELLAIID